MINRLDIEENKISKLEDMAIETKIKKQGRNETKIKEQVITEQLDNFKESNIYGSNDIKGQEK